MSETIKNDPNEQKWGFLGMFLGTLGTSLLANLLTDKGKTKTGKGTITAGENFNATPSFN